MNQRHGSTAGPASDRRRLLMLAATLAFIAVFVRSVFPVPWPVDRSYADEGEIFLHGLAGGTTFRVPGGTILAALALNHQPIALSVQAPAYAALIALLVFALEGLLGCEVCFGLAPLLAALQCLGPEYFPSGPITGFLAVPALLIAGLAVQYARSPTLANSVFVALAVGSTYLFRSSFAFLPPLLAFFSWRFWTPRTGPRRFASLLTLALLPYLFTLPSLLLNYRTQGRIILFEDKAAYANMVTAALGLATTVNGDWTALTRGADGSLPDSVLFWCLKVIAAHPLRYALGYLTRLLIALYWLSPFILFGGWILWLQRRRREYQALGLLVAYWLAIHCLMSLEDRYFFTIKPLVIGLAGVFLGGLAPWGKAAPRRFSTGVFLAGLSAMLAFVLYGAALMQGAGRNSLDKALLRAPKDWWLLQTRAEQSLRGADMAAAERDFSQALTLSPLARDASSPLEWELACAEMFQGRLERVWRLPPEGSHDRNERPIPSLIRASAWLNLGRENLAVTEMKRAVALWIDSAYVWGQSGIDSPMDRRLRALQVEDIRTLFAGKIIGHWPPQKVVELAGLLSRAFPELVAARLAYADALDQAHDPREVRILKETAKMHMEPVDQRRLAESFLQCKEFAAAQKQLDALGPADDFKILLARARAAAGQGDRAAATALFSRAEKQVTTLDRRRDLAIALTAFGDDTGALRHWRQLARVGVATAPLEEAQIYLRQGRRSDAAAALAHGPANTLGADDRRRFAAMLIDVGDFAPALSQIDAMPEPLDDQMFLAKVRALVGLGRSQDARAALKAQTAPPQKPEEFFLRAEGRKIAGDSAGALRIIDSLDAHSDAGLLLSKARFYVTLQDSARALSALQRSLALSPTDEDSFKIGLLLQDLSQTKRAGVIFAELARKHPREARFLNAQGICAYLNGSAPRAEAALSSAIRADPRHWPAYLSLGFVLEKMGRRPEAGALYRRALALSSVNGAVIAQRDRDELISLAASIPEQPKIDARNQ